MRRLDTYTDILTKDALYDCYIVKNMSQRQMAKHFHVDVRNIRASMIRENIPLRTPSQRAQSIYEVRRKADPNYKRHREGVRPGIDMSRYKFTEEQLYNCYINKNMSTSQIAEMFDTNRGVVSYVLRALKIPTRKIAWIPSAKKERPDSGLKCVYKVYEIGAKHRNLSFSLSLELFKELTSSRCSYCGQHPSTQSAYGGYLYNGIDRKDNARGYEPDNVRTACKMCNFAKKGMPENEFVNWLDRIAQFRSGGVA